MSSGSEKQQLFFPEGNRKRLPGGICTGCLAFRAQDRRPLCRALRLQQKDRVPGIRDDAQDAEGRAASAKLQRRLRHSQYCRAVPAGRELQRAGLAVFHDAHARSCGSTRQARD